MFLPSEDLLAWAHQTSREEKWVQRSVNNSTKESHLGFYKWRNALFLRFLTSFLYITSYCSFNEPHARKTSSHINDVMQILIFITSYFIVVFPRSVPLLNQKVMRAVTRRGKLRERSSNFFYLIENTLSERVLGLEEQDVLEGGDEVQRRRLRDAFVDPQLEKIQQNMLKFNWRSSIYDVTLLREGVKILRYVTTLNPGYTEKGRGYKYGWLLYFLTLIKCRNENKNRHELLFTKITWTISGILDFPRKSTSTWNDSRCCSSTWRSNKNELRDSPQSGLVILLLQRNLQKVEKLRAYLSNKIISNWNAMYK